ncbi:AP-3 complex subunit sigma-2 isoform X1 [Ursus americanus]|uniref:AP-3 complex subunit sigma-2 isoform X1 n=1 Tax=Ursus americanus TaxID=9643 RepID=UPI001E67969C|nr:AP-3 complex subunit sigma-2 isoform X1 [Ursus americanus]
MLAEVTPGSAPARPPRARRPPWSFLVQAPGSRTLRGGGPWARRHVSGGLALQRTQRKWPCCDGRRCFVGAAGAGRNVAGKDDPSDSGFQQPREAAAGPLLPAFQEIQQQIVRETFHLVLKRDDNICNFLEGGSLIGGSDYKLIYRHYATLYFVFCVDSSESELGILDLIQVFVETLDKCFENVCELDLIFHMDKVHYILQEVVMGGMVLETNMNEIVAQIEAQNRLEKSEGGLSAAPARAVSAVKNINLPEIPRNINIGDLNIKVPNLSQFV